MCKSWKFFSQGKLTMYQEIPVFKAQPLVKEKLLSNVQGIQTVFRHTRRKNCLPPQPHHLSTFSTFNIINETLLDHITIDAGDCVDVDWQLILISSVICVHLSHPVVLTSKMARFF